MCKLIFWRLSGWPANGTTLSLISHSQGDFNHYYVKLLLGDKGTERQNLETQFMQSPKWKQEPEHPCGTTYNTELDHNFRTRAWKILNFELLYQENISFASCPHCKLILSMQFWSLFPFFSQQPHSSKGASCLNLLFQWEGWWSHQWIWSSWLWFQLVVKFINSSPVSSNKHSDDFYLFIPLGC